MTFFVKNGNRFSVSADGAIDLHEELPVGTYTVKFNQMAEMFYLEKVENFSVTHKLYGSTVSDADRVLNTFADRETSTGVMLSGEKGSGKTLLAKVLSIKARVERGFPTIIINEPWFGEGFNQFMQLIEQPTVIIFDEFEKVYNKEQQEQILTLLDGVYPAKKLFILTCNDRYKVNEHMRNRPGRIFYRFDYTGLENDFIVEFCNDNLNDKTQIDSVCNIAVMFGEFNFDILKAMVEEMNRYGESAAEVIGFLNAKPDQSESVVYDVSLDVDGKTVDPKLMHAVAWSGNPFKKTVELYYRKLELEKTDKVKGQLEQMLDDPEYDKRWHLASFKADNLVSVNATSGSFLFVNEEGMSLSLKKQKTQTYNYGAY